MQGSRQKRVLRAGTKLKMMKNSVIVLLAALAGFVSCSKEGFIGYDRDGDYSGMYGMTMGGGNYPGRPGGQAGILTAGEWNDLDRWDFWSGLMASDEYKEDWDFSGTLLHVNMMFGVGLSVANADQRPKWYR